MTVEPINSVDVEEVSLTSPVADVTLDDSPAVAQFEAIIRAWKREGVGPEGAVPMSPVGEADIDGSLAFGNSDAPDICQSYTYFDTSDCEPGSSYNGITCYGMYTCGITCQMRLCPN